MPKKKTDIQREIEDFFLDDEESTQVNELKKIEHKNNIREIENEDESKKQENIEKMLQTISNSKKIPKDILRKMYSTIFVNLLIAIIIMAYLFFIILGYLNIEKNIYEIDLRVFTGFLFAITIFLMEISYKRKNSKLTIHSIEILCLSICNLFFLYFYTMFYRKYKLIVGLISLSFGAYYVIKSIILFIMMKNKYYRTMSDVNEILSKNYEEEVL